MSGVIGTSDSRKVLACGPAEILKHPYHWTLIPEDDGSWFGRIDEFPGCIATGDTATEALKSLADVADSWLSIVIEKGQSIPEPWDDGVKR